MRVGAIHLFLVLHNGYKEICLLIRGELINCACGGGASGAVLIRCLVGEKNPQFLAGTNVPMRSFSPAIALIALGPLPYNQEREEVCFYHSFSIIFSNFT